MYCRPARPPREPSPLKRKKRATVRARRRRDASRRSRASSDERASSDGNDEQIKAPANASGLSQELERVREAASKEGEATRQKLQLTRDALERALRATAEDQARKARRTPPTRRSSSVSRMWPGRWAAGTPGRTVMRLVDSKIARKN